MTWYFRDRGRGRGMMFCHGQMDGGMDGTDVVIVMG